jgi:hypothetical protein
MRGSILLGSRVDMGAGLGLGLGLGLPCDDAAQRGTRKPKNMKQTNNINVLSFIGCRLVPWICSCCPTPYYRQETERRSKITAQIIKARVEDFDGFPPN